MIFAEEWYEQAKSAQPDAGKVPLTEKRTAYLHLRTPQGTTIRAEIAHGDLDGLLALMFPEDFGRTKEMERGSVSLDFVAKMLGMTPSDLQAAIKRGDTEAAE